MLKISKYLQIQVSKMYLPPSALKYIERNHSIKRSKKVSRVLVTSSEGGFVMVSLGLLLALLLLLITESLVLTYASLTLVLGIMTPVVLTVLSLVEIVSPEQQVAGGRLRRRQQATRYPAASGQ